VRTSTPPLLLTMMTMTAIAVSPVGSTPTALATSESKQTFIIRKEAPAYKHPEYKHPESMLK
jgi:hypothetical protein